MPDSLRRFIFFAVLFVASPFGIWVAITHPALPGSTYPGAIGTIGLLAALLYFADYFGFPSFDTFHEIFERENTAFAVLLAGLFVGLCLLLDGAI